MRSPKLREFGLPTLERRIQDPRTATETTRRLDDGQVGCRDSQPSTFDDVHTLEIAVAKPGAGSTGKSAVARDGDLHDLGCEPRHVKPPCGGQAAGGGVDAV